MDVVGLGHGVAMWAGRSDRCHREDDGRCADEGAEREAREKTMRGHSERSSGEWNGFAA